MAFPLLIPLALGAIRIGSGVAKVGVKAAGAAISVAGSVAKAAGGLLGGGKSGNVMSKAGQSYATNSPQGRMIVQAKKRQKQKEASKKGGMSLAKIKPSISGFSGSSSGAMSLPAIGEGEATPTTLLSQILGQITTNTGLLNSMLQVLATNVAPPPPPPPPPTDVISNAQIEKGGNNEGPGKVKQVFSALGTKVKNITSSLGGVGKFLLKGVLGVGALVAFTKYRDNITGFIARTFEMLEGFGSRFANSDDPLGGFLDSLMSTGEGSILDSLKKGLAFVIEELVFALKLMLNDFLPGFAKLDLTQKQYEGQVSNIDSEKQEIAYAQTVSQPSAGMDAIVGGGADLDDTESIALSKVVTAKISRMYEAYTASGGRVQWTNVGTGFGDTGITSLTQYNPGISVQDILNSTPLFDGKDITQSSLDAGLDYGKGMEGLDKRTLSKVTKLLKGKSDLEQQNRMGITKVDKIFGFGGKTIDEKLQSIEKKILDLKTPSGDTASLTTTPIILQDSGSKVGTVMTGDQIAMATGLDHTDRTQQAIQAMA